MSNKYRYDHRTKSHKKRHIFAVIIISMFVTSVLAIATLVLINQTTKKIKIVSGPTVEVGVVTSNPAGSTNLVNEPYYTFQLPVDWKIVKSVSDSTQNYITWESEVPNAQNRWFTVYTDPIPTTYPVNKELPVDAHGSSLSFGTMSGDCSDFTNANVNARTQPQLAKWQDVDFYCNTPNFADNQIGTGSIGSVNSVNLVGPLTGAHNFFFLYIDRNAAPDYSILYSMLDSFQAK